MIEVPIRVKDALRDGRRLKNYRILVLNEDGTTDFVIDNDTLVSETVDIDERMCSGDTIKFGLCEGSSLEFQYFNHPSIYGRQLKVFVDVQYMGDNGLAWHEIPMGYFTVEKCSRQASTGIKKVTAYNKLKSEYLDQKANKTLLEDVGSSTSMEFNTIIRMLLEDYEIIEMINKVSPVTPEEPHDPSDLSIVWPHTELKGNLPLYFKHQYGINNPINYQKFGDGKVFAIVTTQGSYSVDQSADKFLLQFLVGKFSDFEKAIYSFLEKLLDDAQLKDSNNNTVTGKMVLDNLCQQGIWGYVCGLATSDIINRANLSDFYSTIQYEYEEANNIAHTKCLGKVSDFIYSTHRFVNVLMPCGYTLVNSDAAQGSIEFNGHYTYDGYNKTNVLIYEKWGKYTYYLNANHDVSDEQTVPFFYYRDNLYPGEAMVNNDYEESYDLFMAAGTPLDETDIGNTQVTLSDLPDFTPRDLMSASYETVCQFGKLDRVTDLFSGVELNSSRLFPAEDLYPADNLYPDGAALSSEKSMYSKLWADEGNVQKWRNLIITYKGLDEEQKEKDFTLQRQINADGTQDYNMSDNWIFKNLVWTSAQIGDYADAMVSKMRDMTWFPFEMWCAGLPYIETGDELEISIGETTYTSYVLQRQLKGIQNLQDTYINGTLDIF